MLMLMRMAVAAVALFAAQALSASSGAAVALRDLDGRELAPLDAGRGKPMAARPRAFVFIFLRTDCPISNRYAPEIQRLHDEFAARKIAFHIVYPGAQPVEAIRRHVAEYRYPGVPLRDPSMRLVDLVGATVTPEAAVFDSGAALRYRGRLDDRYLDIGRSRREPTTHDVRDALRALLAGRPVARAAEPAVGCFISDLRS